MDKVRARVVISGHVQGVFFRSNTREIADKYDIHGWVRNLWDGRVEALLEGDRDTVQKMIDWFYKGPPYSDVTGVEVKWEDPTGEFSGFSVVH